MGSEKKMLQDLEVYNAGYRTGLVDGQKGYSAMAFLDHLREQNPNGKKLKLFTDGYTQAQRLHRDITLSNRLEKLQNMRKKGQSQEKELGR